MLLFVREIAAAIVACDLLYVRDKKCFIIILKILVISYYNNYYYEKEMFLHVVVQIIIN